METKDTVLLERQMEIETLIKDRKYDEIGNLPGYSIIERFENRPVDEDCLRYVSERSGGNTNPYILFDEITTQWSEVQEPEKGDVVIYFDLEGNWRHIGIAEDPETSISKFGVSHVFKHPIKVVPTYYGNIIKYFRKSDNK